MYIHMPCLPVFVLSFSYTPNENAEVVNEPFSTSGENQKIEKPEVGNETLRTSGNGYWFLLKSVDFK